MGEVHRSTVSPHLDSLFVPNYCASITIPLPKDEVPQQFESLLDLTSLYKVGEALDTYSRRNWLSYAVQECASRYGLKGLSYLSRQAVVLSPKESESAATGLSNLLLAIAQDPSSLPALLEQDAWSNEEIHTMLQADASPWGPLYESDDGDELPYLLSFLKCQMALLRYASSHGLHVAYAQSP